ncbi:MAG: hypothetical protein ACTTIC_06110 [Helicobacteraceae bacterium]
MPHALTKAFELPQFPFCEGGFEYLFGSVGLPGVVGVKHSGREFLLELYPKNGNVLIKVDKKTRPLDLSVVKLSVLNFIKAARAVTISSNLQNIRPQRSYGNLIAPGELKNLPREQKIWVEIGFGSGEMIIKNAKAHPEILHVGIEIYAPALEKVLKILGESSIQNVLLARCDARLAIESLSGKNCERILVHFPVPWDKNPTKRVFSENFICSCRKVLRGSLELRTDSAEYKDYVLGLYEKMGLKVALAVNKDSVALSKYEKRWKQAGKDIYDVIFTNAAPVLDLVQDLTQDPAVDPAQDLKRYLAQDPTQDPAQDLLQDPSQNQVQDLAQDPALDLVQDQAQDLTRYLAQDPSRNPARILVQDPSQDLAADPTPAQIQRVEPQASDFSFPPLPFFDKNILFFADKAFICKDFMIKLIKVFKVRTDLTLYKILIGKSAFGQTLYILSGEQGVRYYGAKPYELPENYLAHQKILKVGGGNFD